MPPRLSEQRAKTKPLPRGFVSIQDVLDLNGVTEGRLTNIIGLATDFMAPIATHRDYKSTISLGDLSTEGNNIKFTLFLSKQEDHPAVNAGDVIMLFQVKVQSYLGGISLITNNATVIYAFDASKIPKPPRPAEKALKHSVRGHKRPVRPEDLEYVSWLFHHYDKAYVPDEAEFEALKERSLNVKDKFRLLKDVRESQFCDMLVQVVREPYDDFGRVTLYVSDYTENDAFFNFSPGDRLVNALADDPYGYTGKSSSYVDFPVGKRALQLTCFEPHGEHIREEGVHAGDWVELRNVHVTYGRNTANLEGKLRTDQQFSGKRQVYKLDTDVDQSNPSVRLKDALRRKLEYQKTHRQNRPDSASGQGSTPAAQSGLKRKSEEAEEPRQNAKIRRKEKRAVALQKEQRAEQQLGLNEQVVCEIFDNEPASAVSEVISSIVYKTAIDGKEVELPLPFNCAKYRTNVRVVDYRPSDLASFSTPRKVSEFDLLRQESSCVSSDEDESLSTFASQADAGRIHWEWRFALQLEDAKTPGQRFWAVVDNPSAQLLTGFDASDLRGNAGDLADLRERLFTLWGDLEEKKSVVQAQAEARRARRPGDRPALDSSDNEDATDGADKRKNKKKGAGLAPSNKPFKCCIRQYGVKVKERDPRRADAGEGRRWERVFGLFGTKIRVQS